MCHMFIIIIIIIKKGRYFASLNNFIPHEKGRCSKVYNFIEICITHGMCVDHTAREKQVGFIIHFYYIDTSVLLENIPLVKFIKTTSGI